MQGLNGAGVALEADLVRFFCEASQLRTGTG